MKNELIRKAVKDVMRRGKETDKRRKAREQSYTHVKSVVAQNLRVQNRVRMDKLRSSASPAKDFSAIDISLKKRFTKKSNKKRGKYDALKEQLHDQYWEAVKKERELVKEYNSKKAGNSQSKDVVERTENNETALNTSKGNGISVDMLESMFDSKQEAKEVVKETSAKHPQIESFDETMRSLSELKSKIFSGLSKGGVLTPATRD